MTDLSPEQTFSAERLAQAKAEETVEAMIERYKNYGQPIDEEGYIREQV
jgi:hypothetical protein